MKKFSSNELRGLKTSIYIYKSGYQTGCGYTLKEWFECRARVKRASKEKIEQAIGSVVNKGVIK